MTQTYNKPPEAGMSIERARKMYVRYASQSGELDPDWVAHVMSGGRDDQHGLRIALAAINDWRPIAEAEIDGFEQNPDVLVFVPEVGQMIARYEKDNDGGHDWFPMDQHCTIAPTHWMPLPDDPQPYINPPRSE
jgi:hypothetical protein